MASKYGLVGAILTVLIGVILVGSVLAPVIDDVQKTAGDEVTLTNNSNIVLREAVEGDVLKCERTVITQGSSYSDVWTLNDETITNISSSALAWNVAVMSDGVFATVTASGSSPTAGAWYDMTSASPLIMNIGAGSLEEGSVATWTCEFGAENITVTDRNDNATEYPYTWAYVICPYSDGTYCAAVSGGVGIVQSADDVVLCGAYTSGENDTMYYYKDGTSYVSNTDYTMTVDIATELHEDTTDIYDATVTVAISDEEFTPYRILVPYEVSGHATDGAEYNLYGIIVVLFIVSLFAVAVTSILRRSEN